MKSIKGKVSNNPNLEACNQSQDKFSYQIINQITNQIAIGDQIWSQIKNQIQTSCSLRPRNFERWRE